VCVRITKLPTQNDFDLQGFDVSRFKVGRSYEVGPRLGELLVVCGYAELEMRSNARGIEHEQRCADDKSET
jgi:hypothetical protein